VTSSWSFIRQMYSFPFVFIYAVNGSSIFIYECTQPHHFPRVTNRSL